MRYLAFFSGVVFAGILMAGVLLRPDRPLRIGTGVVANDLCSGVFVSGLDPDRVFADSLAPRAGLSLIARGLSWRVDRTKRSVTASLLGLIDARAVAYNGLGCILLQGEPPNGLPSTAELAALRSATPPRPELAGSEPEWSQPVEPASPKLKAALDQAFLGPDTRRSGAQRRWFVELDSTGTMIGSHYMLATTRDWARFGQLYPDDGAIDGRRILPKGWVEFSARATLGTNYGAGFWTNRTTAPEAEARVAAGMPRDAYFASGNLGQRIVILPSQQMVIVRMGDATGPGNDMVGLIRLVRSAFEAVGSGA